MGEFTQDIRTLPTPDQLYDRRLKRDRDKLFSDRENLSGIVSDIQDELIKTINRGDRRSMMDLSNRWDEKLHTIMTKQGKKEALVIIKKWLDMYGYRLVMCKTIVPKRKGIIGRLYTIGHCHVARCYLYEGLAVASVVGGALLAVGLLVGLIVWMVV